MNLKRGRSTQEKYLAALFSGSLSPLLVLLLPSIESKESSADQTKQSSGSQSVSTARLRIAKAAETAGSKNAASAKRASFITKRIDSVWMRPAHLTIAAIAQ